jgi:MSHA biogenesis protein MshI
MRWPWSRRRSDEWLLVSMADNAFAFVRAGLRSDGLYEIRQIGVQPLGDAGAEALVSRLHDLGLKGLDVRAMLRPPQYQFLQIDAPAVAPEELRSAARYQIRDMLDVHVDDITLDVMRVGDGNQKGTQHLFVVAATNSVMRGLIDLGDKMQWQMPVIDIQETAQRNLQSALARQEGLLARADAALVLVEPRQALLTISANDELFYTRRLEVPEGFLQGPLGSMADEVEGSAVSAYVPVAEYVPDYSVGGVAYGSDYSDPKGPSRAAATDQGADHDRAQRFLVEVQRSLDLWDRTWSSMPLGRVRVYAGARSDELAQWLTRELGQPVVPMDVNALFPGLAELQGNADLDLCWPLLGLALRTDIRKL